MVRQPFQPVGSQPRWRNVYDRARTLEHGAILTYQQLEQITGNDPRNDRQPVYRATIELEETDHKSLVCVPNVGYRVALPSEHRSLTERHRRRSYRQLKTARRKADSADRSKLTDDERRWFDETSIRLSQVETAARNLHRRVRSLERSTEVNQVAQSRIEREMQEMRDAMAAAGLLRGEQAA